MKAVVEFIDNIENQLGPRHHPFVTLCFAQSLDGSIARRRGIPLAISSAESMRITHFLRSIHDGILVGVGTVISDDPQLTVREIEGENPQPIIIDPRFRIPTGARIFDHPRPPWIFTGLRNRKANKINEVEKKGKVFNIQSDSSGRFSLSSVLTTLRGEGTKRLMVEGGAKVMDSFIRENFVDVVVITIAPAFVGGLKSFKNPLTESSQIMDYPTIKNPQSAMVGDDIWIWGKIAK